MKIHKGRLIDHIHLEVSDLKKSRHFYETVLGVFGIEIAGEGEGYFFADELFVSSWGGTPSRIHIAFQAADESVVKRFHEAGLKAGGVDKSAVPAPSR